MSQLFFSAVLVVSLLLCCLTAVIRKVDIFLSTAEVGRAVGRRHGLAMASVSI